MQIGNPAPDWAPKAEDTIFIRRLDNGLGYYTLPNPEKFVVFMADFFPNRGVRLIGRWLLDLDDPVPGVIAFYIESKDDFYIIQK